ncbi:hypothetical protein, partial [Rhizobium leguminosarum]|uniref:hypothetical protein n=1 Tax=Rhizobium leguminosarum TaxID=384 RepID=UPI003F949CE7
MIRPGKAADRTLRWSALGRAESTPAPEIGEARGLALVRAPVRVAAPTGAPDPIPPIAATVI